MTVKPENIDEYIRSFVTELNKLLKEGLKLNEVNVPFKLRCFICDTPARSMLRGNEIVL